MIKQIFQPQIALPSFNNSISNYFVIANNGLVNVIIKLLTALLEILIFLIAAVKASLLP